MAIYDLTNKQTRRELAYDRAIDAFLEYQTLNRRRLCTHSFINAGCDCGHKRAIVCVWCGKRADRVQVPTSGYNSLFEDVKFIKVTTRPYGRGIEGL